MELEDTTNLVEAADTPEADGTEGFETGVEQEADGNDDPELDDDGNPIDPEPEEEFEEVERGDKKYKVPKALASELLMQADYTRKTQELADQRKAFDAERGTVQQADAAEMNARGQLASMDQQIAHMGKIDWRTWMQTEPFDAQEEFAQFQLLKESRADLAGRLSQHVNQRTLETQRETVKLIEEGKAVLARDIKGWSPQLAETLLETGVTQYGFARAEIEEFTDPRMVKVLHDAHQFQALQAKQAKAAKLAKGQEVAPVQTLKGASGKAPVNGSTRDFAAFERMANKALK